MTYRNFKLPHIHPVGATFSILLCVNDAVPKPLIQRLNAEREEELKIARLNSPHLIQAIQRKYDKSFNDLLRRSANQKHPFATPLAAEIMVNALKRYAGTYYDLNAYSVMSNHVHAQLDFSLQIPVSHKGDLPPEGYVSVSHVIKLIKGGSAYQTNKLLGRTGSALWPKRYRDRFIRGERHLELDWQYTLNNPVEAGLVEKTEDHPFTGGLSWEEMILRQPRRRYPFPGKYYDELAEYDKANPGRNRDYSTRSHGL